MKNIYMYVIENKQKPLTLENEYVFFKFISWSDLFG